MYSDIVKYVAKSPRIIEPNSINSIHSNSIDSERTFSLTCLSHTIDHLVCLTVLKVKVILKTFLLYNVKMSV